MTEPRSIELSDGRRLSFDDVGDRDGRPVLFVHGTPDSRRARHPDDGSAAAVGVRLVSVDRPGSGGSTFHPGGTVGSFGDDAVALADALGIDRWRIMAWSAGSVYALATAGRHPHRVEAVAVVAGLVPFEAYSAPGLLDDADGGRHMVAELGAELGAAGLAEMAAPMLAPHPCTMELAREHVLESSDPARRAALEAIPGATEAMAAGVFDAVAQGTRGITRDLELQVEPPDVDWSTVSTPVHLWYGERDTTSPPAFGRWWAERLPRARLTVVPGEGHLVALTRWAEILEDLVA